jgi:hypothetical protein
VLIAAAAAASRWWTPLAFAGHGPGAALPVHSLTLIAANLMMMKLRKTYRYFILFLPLIV